MRRAALALILSSCLTGAAAAQLVPPLNSKPEADAKPTPVPAARDIPFPGTVQLTVDATDVTRGIFRVHERVPVTGPSDLVLLYPKWVPGGHSPRGDIKNVTGIRVTANGQRAEVGARPARRVSHSMSRFRREFPRSKSNSSMFPRRPRTRAAPS